MQRGLVLLPAADLHVSALDSTASVNRNKKPLTSNHRLLLCVRGKEQTHAVISLDGCAAMCPKSVGVPGEPIER